MKAHAGGGTTPSRPSPDARPSPPVPKPSFTAATGGGATVGKSPAVQKGFLGSGGGGGVLYGEEGSREGGAVSGNGGRSSRVDREFDRLMALADPEMGDGGSGTDGQVKVEQCWLASVQASHGVVASSCNSHAPPAR